VLTIESTAIVDEAHRLTLAVPASVPPGAHSVVIVIRDCADDGGRERGVMRAVPDFQARQQAAGMRPLSVDEAGKLDRFIAGEAD
jgi:hypothetical protein